MLAVQEEQHNNTHPPAPASEFSVSTDSHVEGERRCGGSTLEKYEARIRKDVAEDISAMLSNSKAYVQHHSMPAISNPRHVKNLAAPKPVRMHPETRLARRLEDPVLWAKLRALQLEEAREAREAANVVLARKEEEKQRQLQAFREKKQQEKLKKEEAKNKAKQEDAAYAAELAKYVNRQAAIDLKRQKEKKAEALKAKALHEKLTSLS